jgi:hypothetical protein
MTGLNPPICSGMSQASLSGTSSCGMSSGGLQKPPPVSGVPVVSPVSGVPVVSPVSPVLADVSPLLERVPGPVLSGSSVVVGAVVVPDADIESVPPGLSESLADWLPSVGVPGPVDEAETTLSLSEAESLADSTPLSPQAALRSTHLTTSCLPRMRDDPAIAEACQCSRPAVSHAGVRGVKDRGGEAVTMVDLDDARSHR